MSRDQEERLPTLTRKQPSRMAVLLLQVLTNTYHGVISDDGPTSADLRLGNTIMWQGHTGGPNWYFPKYHTSYSLEAFWSHFNRALNTLVTHQHIQVDRDYNAGHCSQIIKLADLREGKD